jgi:hypothetical protein
LNTTIEPHGFYTEQLSAIERFFLDPNKSLMRLILDPEFRNMPVNYLVQREDQPDFPHILLGFFEPFHNPTVWIDGLVELVNSEIAENVEAGSPICETSEHKLASFPLAQRDILGEFLEGINDFAESLPDNAGALVFLLDPSEIGDDEQWLRRMQVLADGSHSSWLKFLVLEPRLGQPLASLADHPRVESLLFWMSPEEIEKRADNVLKLSGGLEGYSS